MPAQLAAALKKARLAPAVRKIERLAREACGESSLDRAQALDRFFVLLEANRDVLWDIVRGWRYDVGREFLDPILNELRKETRKGGGQSSNDSQGNDAPSDQTRSGQSEGDGQRARAAPHQTGGGQSPGEHQHTRAPSGLSPEKRAAQAAADTPFRSLWFSQLINGKPMRDCTPDELFSRATYLRRDAWAIMHLCENLPLNEPIGKYRSDEEAEATLAQAKRRESAGEFDGT